LCLLGGFVFLTPSLMNLVIDGQTVSDMIVQTSNITLQVGEAMCFSAMVTCAGGAVQCKFVINYFVQELKDGEPFRKETAELLQKAAFKTFICSIITIVVSSIVFFVLTIGVEGTYTNEFSGVSLALPLDMYFMGVIFKYGAEQKGSQQVLDDINK